MPYAVKFYTYIFFVKVLAVVVVARWVKLFGFVASLAFGLVFAYLTIVSVTDRLTRARAAKQSAACTATMRIPARSPALMVVSVPICPTIEGRRDNSEVRLF